MVTYFNVYNSLESAQVIGDRIQFDKTENSFEFIERWDGPSLKEARDYTRQKLKQCDLIAANELKNEIESNEVLERSIITTFNFFEGMYISIYHNRINEELLKESFAILYCRMYEAFKIWIDSQDPVFQKNLKNFYNLCHKWTTLHTS